MKKYLLFLFSFLIAPLVVAAQTDISGNIVNNTTLTAANSPYIVTGNLNVDAGATLTVEPGVEMRFNSGVYLQVYGTMQANGATFTANQSTTRGFWKGIYVSYESSSDIGTVVLDNCLVEYAQSLFVRKGDLTLTNNTLVKDFSGYGIDIYTAGTLNIDNTTVQNCSYPVYFRDKGGNGKWTVGAGVSLTGNDNDYVFIDFRDVNSHFHLSNAGIPYYYNSELRVTETGVLTIDPGTSILATTGGNITVNGKFKALGTQADPVTFANEPLSSYWSGINFLDPAIDTACILTYCNFSGANYTYYDSRNYEISKCAVEVINSSPSFNNCEFTDNRYNLVVTGRSFPIFADCNFMPSNLIDKQTLNINMDLNADPVFNNCSAVFNNNEARAIGIIGSTVYGDSRLGHRSFTNLDSISYTLYGNVIIQDTASLTIDPGIVIKSTGSGDYIQANGALTAVGTTDNPIVFTHVGDDSFGRPSDTYQDGITSIPNSSAGRIILNSQATSTLENWKILYAGMNSSNFAVTANYGNIIKNCDISNSYRGILFSGDAQILNNTFENINNYPLSRRMNDGLPVLIGNTVANSGFLGIYVYDFLDGTYAIGGLDIGTNTNVAYIIDNNTYIPENTDVTILPGTIFKFASYYGKLSVRGGLNAEGSKNNKIIFTSLWDNSAGGNTNFNTGSDPTGYKWNGIEFLNTSHDAVNQLKNCEVRYVNNGLVMTDCKIVIDSVLLNFSSNHAMEIYGTANPVITNSVFNNLESAPVHMDMFASPVFSNNSVANVTRIGISINGGTISGTVPARSFAGYDTITYLINETLRVDDQLTIPAGLTFKASNSSYFDIYGTLNILGTAARPVVFTSLQDDAYGKPSDTEQNGNTSINTYGNRIVFRDLSDDNSIIDHALFRYSYDYAITAEKASPTIKNSTFYKTNNNGITLVGASAPTVDSCRFEDLTFPVITSLVTFPGSYRGNVLAGTTAHGILITDNETLTQNYTLKKRSFAGIANIPYIFNRYNVGTSAVLTIEPGVVCKFRQDGYLNVRNGLKAAGGSTADSAIVFTSDRDDFYGGDTYGDGDANLANDHWWRGIYFPAESIDDSCLIDNCILKNASYYYSYNVNSYNRGAITLDNSSPTVQNTLFESNYWGIIVRNTSLPAIIGCDFVDTNPDHGYGIWNENQVVTVVAQNCWWNDPSGPYNATLNPDGQGESVSDGVNFTPWVSQTAKPIMGDVSLNGEVMPYDASLVLQHTVGNITLDAKQLAVADVSRNQTVSSYDASLILQYSIGLITNFDQAQKKSASAFSNPIVTAPAEMDAVTGSSFEVPLTFITPASVKSVDMQFKIDPGRLDFVSLNKNDIPSHIMAAAGYNETTGILKVSLTSAYDLDLNINNLGLIFDAGEKPAETTSIELVQLTANETALNDDLFTILVSSTGSTTGLPSLNGVPSLNIYSFNDIVTADLELASPQSELVFSIYDITGRMMSNKIIRNLEKGNHKISFPIETAQSGNSSRMYLIMVKGDNFMVTRKLLLR